MIINYPCKYTDLKRIFLKKCNKSFTFFSKKLTIECSI